MTLPRPEEQALFHAARHMQAPEARRRYLEQACGADRDLLARIEGLLAFHDEGGSFLESPAEGCPAAFVETIVEGPGTVLGPYRLLGLLGEGGMGTVYRAAQAQPVQRQVAVKILKPGLNSGQFLARFEAERQALALMDHPNIARVLDAGETLGAQAGGSPRPYLVMELVAGVPITQYCDAQRLTVRQRLELLVQVCRAVQHAHQKGIIHRDLKPSNILVAQYDGRPVPKIIDFGVAKAIGPKLTARTLVTEVGTIIGTLDYMSPEQAIPDQLDIDTRSDVYALGALLYELLTGATPLRREPSQPVGLLELLRRVREEDPPRPSACLRQKKEERGSRKAEKRPLARFFSCLLPHPSSLPSSLIPPPSSLQELDWIVMKCLEKDRARRYETANGLARDLERYLHEEPVEAGPPSTRYRLRKFTRRHRRLLGAVGAFALLLVLSAVVSTWQMIRATGAELAADRERDKAVAEKERAEEQAAIARAVSDFLQADLLGQADIRNQAPGSERNRNITVRELLDRAARQIETKFAGQQRTEAAVRRTLGRAYRALGEYPEAQTHLERAYALCADKLGAHHADTLESMIALANLHLDRCRYDQAEPLLRQVLEAQRAQLGPGHLDTLRSMHNLATLCAFRGHYEEAETLHKQVLEGCRAQLGSEHTATLISMNNLALLYTSRGQFDEAEGLYRQALEVRRATLGADHPDTLRALHNLASLCANRGRYDEAERLFKQALAAKRAKLGPTHPLTLASMSGLAAVYQSRRQYEEAEALHRQALDGYRAQLGANHPNTLASIHNLAVLYRNCRRFEEAEPLLRQVLDGYRARLGADHPSTLVTLQNLASLCADHGRYDEAESLYREAVAGAKKKFGLSHPRTQAFINDLTDFYTKQRKLDLAEPLLRELADSFGEKDACDSPEYAFHLARLSSNLLEQKKYAEAETVARACLTMRAKKEPDLWSAFNARSMLGGALLGQEKYEEAEPLLRQAYEGMKEREAQIPKDAQGNLTKALERLVRLYDAWGKPEQAAHWRQRLAEQQSQPKP